MPATFDGPSLTITLPTHGGSGVLDLNTQVDLYSDWKEWVLSDFKNQGFPPAFRVDGGSDLTPGIKQGAYYFLRNDLGWRIKPAEEDATIYAVGNLVPQDSSLPIGVPTDGDFTVFWLGLQPITQSVEEILNQSQIALYEGNVSIDSVSGQAGTSYPLGTKSFPVNNFIDAESISDTLGFNDYELFGTIPFTGSENLDNKRFQGITTQNSVLIFNGNSVEAASFTRLVLIGDMDGNCQAESCVIPAPGVTGFQGGLTDCLFLGDVVIDAAATNDIYVLDSRSGVAGTGQPIFDCNGATVDFNIRNWTGGFDVHNFSGGGNMSIDVNSGSVTIQPTCTAGTILVRGVCNINDQSGPGCTVIDRTVSFEDVHLTRKILSNRQEVYNGQLIIYDDDSIGVIATFNLFDIDGNPTTANAFRRAKA